MQAALAEDSVRTAPRPLPLYHGDSLLFGVLPALREDPIGVMLRACAAHGDAVRLRLPGRSLVVLRSPRAVQHVLIDNMRSYTKQTRGYDMLRLVLGNGLVTSEGEYWRRQRRIAQPAFHRERLTVFTRVMTDAADAMLQRWQRSMQAGTPLDVSHEMMRVTLSIASRTLLSRDVSDDADEVGAALLVALEHANYRILRLLSPSERIPTPRNVRFRRAVATLHRVVDGVIAQRRAEAPGTGETADLLGMMMRAQDAQTGERMSDVQLRDEAMTMFLAGHETTAMTLTWTLYLLSKHPDVERRLRAEVDSVLQGRAPQIEDLKRLPLTDRVIRESMRLYPPVWVLGRLAAADDVVDGFQIKKGDLVFVSSYVTHRSPSLWENPEGFDPDRFLPEREAQRPRCAYFPFSVGQRKCIGDQFATLETNLILPMIVQRARLALVPGQTDAAAPLITLRPQDRMMMHVHPAATTPTTATPTASA